MQPRLHNTETISGTNFALRICGPLFLAITLSLVSLTVSAQDIGAELDQAEGASGGNLSTPSTPPATAAAPSAPPGKSAKSEESKAIPLSNDPVLEGPIGSNEAVAPPPGSNSDSQETDKSEKQKTIEAKDSGDNADGSAKEDVPSQKICNCKFEATVPYRDRKPTISGFFGLEVGSYVPVNYTPDFVATSFSNYYSQTPVSAGVNFGAKYNSPIGALGLQMGGSFFTTTNATDGSTLTVIPATIGIIAELNTIFSEPYVVPYAIFGEYTGIYTEKSGAFTVKGNSPFSQFYAVGLMFQLDWMDEESHIEAYQNFGLENTFVYVEGRQYLSSGSGIPDLSTPLQFAGGLKLEF